MSVKVMGQVWDSDLPREEKYILLSYADHAAHDGTSIYPSVGRTAWKTGYSERSVQRITRELEVKGILISDGTGPHGVNRWRIAISKLPYRESYSTHRGDTMSPLIGATEGVTEKTDGVTKAASGDDTMSPNPSLDPSLDPSLESSATDKQKSVSKEPTIILLSPPQLETPEQKNQAERDERIRSQEESGKGPLGAALSTHVRGASDESSWTTPPSAGGADPFTDGPLTAWCELVGRSRERLPPKRAASCARQLRRIAEQQGANAEQLTWALRQWKRAIIAHAFREKGKPVLIPGNQEWQKPTWRSLWIYKDDPDRNMGQELASLLEYGMDHGLADLDLTKDPTVAAAPERRDEPPERMGG